MRLIDADALIKEFDPNGERLDPILVRSRIVQQPTAYNVEKVVEEIEKWSVEEAEIILPLSKETLKRTVVASKNAIEIVRKGGVE